MKKAIKKPRSGRVVIHVEDVEAFKRRRQSEKLRRELRPDGGPLIVQHLIPKSIRVPADVNKRIQELASYERMTWSSMAITLLEEALSTRGERL